MTRDDWWRRAVAAIALAVLGGCTADRAEDAASPPRPTKTTAIPEASPAPSPTPTAPADGTPSFTPDPADEVPEPTYDLSQGMDVWGVYFIATSYEDPELEETINTLQAIGYKPSSGDVACDQGAAESLGLSPKQRARVALYFTSRRAAEEFATRIEPRPIGIARVRLFCLD